MERKVDIPNTPGSDDSGLSGMFNSSTSRSSLNTAEDNGRNSSEQNEILDTITAPPARRAQDEDYGIDDELNSFGAPAMRSPSANSTPPQSEPPDRGMLEMLRQIGQQLTQYVGQKVDQLETAFNRRMNDLETKVDDLETKVDDVADIATKARAASESANDTADGLRSEFQNHVQITHKNFEGNTDQHQKTNRKIDTVDAKVKTQRDDLRALNLATDRDRKTNDEDKKQFNFKMRAQENIINTQTGKISENEQKIRLLDSASSEQISSMNEMKRVQSIHGDILERTVSLQQSTQEPANSNVVQQGGEDDGSDSSEDDAVVAMPDADQPPADAQQ